AITQAAPLYPNTTIIENGEAQAIIVTPDDRDWQALGEELAQAIAEVAGCSPAVKTASELGDEDLYEINAIVLGSIVNNRRLLYSYSHSQLFADDYYPGSSGYDVRSIHDPWGTSKNIISIGASDIEGARAGVAALIKKFGDGGSRLVIPRILEVHLTGEAQRREGRHFTAELGDEYIEQQKNEAESGLKAGIHTGLFGQARKVGALYALTRKPDYARVFVWLIRRAKAHYDTKPGTYGGPWGMDSDFAIYSVMPAWDEVEEDPSLTDQDRLDVSRILFDWVSEVGVAGRARGPKVRYNHQTFPALGLTYAGHYFAKHYQVIEAHEWLNIAANTFAVQIDTDKAHCDCNAYQWLTLHHTILYSLATQNLKYFENGNMRRNAEYAIHTMNNLGFQVAYGDIGHWGIIGIESYILQIAEWYYRDGRARWVFDKKMAIRNLTATSQYRTCQVEPVSPEDLSGATVWPLAELWYKSFLDESGIPFDRTVDKIIFREGFDPNDQYLLLDGLSISGHGHKDGNSILAWSQNNRVWLTDGDYIKALPKFHNGVLVLRDGQSATMPPAVELVSFSDLPSTAVSRTVKCNYAGADWMRNIVWLKGRVFLVLDHMEAKTDGEFSFRAVWQTIGEVDHQGSVLDINQKGQFARLAMTDDISTLLHDDPALGKNWAAYPHATEPIIRVFQGVLAQDMKQGDTAYLFTALHASGDKPSPAGLRRVAPNAAVLTGDGEPVLLVSPSPTHREVLPGLIQGDAELFVVSPSRLVAVGATRLDVQGVTQTFPIPTDVEIDFCSHTRTQMPTRRSANKAPESPIQDAVPVSVTAAALFKAIDDLLAKMADPAKAEVSGPSAPAVTQLWQFSTEATELGRLDSFTCLDAADIDADGSDEIFAGAESGYVYCLNSDGSLRWSFNTQAAVSDLATVDFLGDGQRWVVAGGPGGKVFGIDHDG
ncbi:MAG: hypothetical protein GXY44_08670, partial [Phycisphaerales bacterium]|nr:hypothetical protein [Phycisphaerales bacterium]